MNNDERVIVFIPQDGEYIEILGHIITWKYGWEEFLEYLKQCDLAMAKATPKKPIGDLHSVPHYRCPNCKGGVKMYEDSRVFPNCHHCGQALDWSDEDENC